MNNNVRHTIKKDIVIHKDKIYKCDICNMSFLQYDNLSRHLVMDNNINNVFYPKE